MAKKAKAPSSEQTSALYLPAGLTLAAAWAWRLGVLGAAVYVCFRAAVFFAPVLVPFLIAMLLSALLAPLVKLLVRWHLPRGVAVAIALLLATGVLAGLFSLIGARVVDEFDELVASSRTGLTQLSQSIADSRFAPWWSEVEKVLFHNPAFSAQDQRNVLDTALQVTGTAGQVLTGTFLALFCSIFMLHDGRKMWLWALRFMPSDGRAVVDSAGQKGWQTLTSFVQATVVVAFVDAVGIGLGALVLNVPLVVPIMVIVFLGAFVPMLGAVVTGAVAVLVAFVAQGPIVALIMLAVVIVVQQLESHVLQPLLLGRAVAVHPVAVVMAIGAGLIMGGIVGALFAVPTVAIANTMITSLVDDIQQHASEPQES